jgi:hypothetical protein
VTSFVNWTDIGDMLMNSFVSCRGCGCAVSAFDQAALAAHISTCAPLRGLK